MCQSPARTEGSSGQTSLKRVLTVQEELVIRSLIEAGLPRKVLLGLLEVRRITFQHRANDLTVLTDDHLPLGLENSQSLVSLHDLFLSQSFTSHVQRRGLGC